MNSLRILLVAVVAALLSAGTAQAGQITPTYDNYGQHFSCSGGGTTSTCDPLTVSSGALMIWNFHCSSLGASCADALPSNPGVTPSNRVYSGNYTGDINFADTSHNSIGAFIASAGGSLSPSLGSAGGDLLSSPFTQHCTGYYPHRTCTTYGTVTIMEFTFTLTASADLYIAHDDGISVWGTGSNSNVDYLNVSSPTVEVTNNVLLGAGTYDLWYAEVNGLPADLITCLVPTTQGGPTPEPLTLSLFGAGLAGAVAIRRRRKKA